MNSSEIELNGEYSGKRVIGCVRFDYDRLIRNPMREDWRCRKSILEVQECLTGFVSEFEDRVLVCEMGEQDYDIGVVVNELAVEVSEAQERLNVLDFPRFRPIADDFYLVLSHAKACGRQDKPKVFHAGHMELAFGGLHVEAGLAQSAEDFPNVLLVGLLIIRVNEYVVNVDDHE